MSIAWFGAIARVTREGEVSMEFDYDNDPDFGREIPAHVYLTDQKLFPRDAEHIPEWLAQKHIEGAENPPPAPRTHAPIRPKR